MNITIGQNIKQYRKENDLTQEQLAEIFGVTAQTISRWELGTAYPDITMLPVLANFFGVSTDTLLGVDISRKDDEIKAALEYNSTLHREGKHVESEAFVREKLKLYPDNAELTYQLAYALSQQTADNDEQIQAINNEIEMLCKRAIHLDNGSWTTHAARQMLCLNYNKQGLREKAMEIAESMPTWWVSREFLLQIVAPMEEAASQRQYNLVALMDMIILHLRKIARDMPSDEHSIAVLDKAVAVADIIAGDDMKFHHERICKCHLWRARYFCRMGDKDSAFEALEKAFYHTVQFESRPECSKYEAFWLWRIEDVRANERKDMPENLYQHLLRKVNEPVFEMLHSDERFKLLIDKINDYITE